MSTARQQLNWEEMFSLAIDSEKPKQMRSKSIPEDDKTCTMCGKMCAVKNVNEILF
jgi:phosphomethylpyrimidine synthase